MTVPRTTQVATGTGAVSTASRGLACHQLAQGPPELCVAQARVRQAHQAGKWGRVELHTLDLARSAAKPLREASDRNPRQTDTRRRRGDLDDAHPEGTGS